MGKKKSAKTFTGWLKGFHTATLAKELGVENATIYAWLADHTKTPSKDLMRRIRRYSDGHVTYEMMIDRTAR